MVLSQVVRLDASCPIYIWGLSQTPLSYCLQFRIWILTSNWSYSFRLLGEHWCPTVYYITISKCFYIHISSHWIFTTILVYTAFVARESQFSVRLIYSPKGMWVSKRLKAEQCTFNSIQASLKIEHIQKHLFKWDCNWGTESRGEVT